LIKKGAAQYLNDQLTIRLKSTMFNTNSIADETVMNKEVLNEVLGDEGIVTTEDEYPALACRGHHALYIPLLLLTSTDSVCRPVSA